MIAINSNDIDFNKSIAVIKLDREPTLNFLKALVDLGYSNLEYCVERIYGLISKDNRKVSLEIYYNPHGIQPYVYINISDNWDHHNFDESITVDYKTEDEQKKAYEQFALFIREKILSPEELVIKGIVE